MCCGCQIQCPERHEPLGKHRSGLAEASYHRWRVRLVEENKITTFMKYTKLSSGSWGYFELTQFAFYS